MNPYIMSGLIGVVGTLAGYYFAGYLNKKGENLATHEDIDKLVEQVTAVTAATKQIEAKISDDVWDRQKRWELKRDLLFEAAKRLGAVDDALTNLAVTYRVARNSLASEQSDWEKKKIDFGWKWNTASTEFDETRLLVGIICSKEVKDAVDQFGVFARTVSIGIAHDDPEIYDQSRKELAAKVFAVSSAIRKELEVDKATKPAIR